MSIIFLQFLLGVVFLSIIFLHLTKKNLAAVIAYVVQSLSIAMILLDSFFETGNLPLLFVVFATVIVKVVLASVFLIRLIRRHALAFSVTTYLNLPLTLLVLAAFTALAHSERFSPLTTIIPHHQALLSIALSAILISIFLIVNRKGAISQLIGILSLENSIVAFAVFAGLEQSPGLQVGIIFDLLIWLLVATVFVSMVYRHFGSLDVDSMKNLKD